MFFGVSGFLEKKYSVCRGFCIFFSSVWYVGRFRGSVVEELRVYLRFSFCFLIVVLKYYVYIINFFILSLLFIDF